jgi:hypothetical protein
VGASGSGINNEQLAIKRAAVDRAGAISYGINNEQLAMKRRLSIV